MEDFITRLEQMAENMDHRCQAAERWITANMPQFQAHLEMLVRGMAHSFNRLARNIGRLMIVGIILSIVAGYFCPDFADKYPVIYGWFTGWLQFGEFAMRAGLGSIYALCTGNFAEFWQNYTAEADVQWNHFLEWLNSIAF